MPSLERVWIVLWGELNPDVTSRCSNEKRPELPAPRLLRSVFPTLLADVEKRLRHPTYSAWPNVSLDSGEVERLRQAVLREEEGLRLTLANEGVLAKVATAQKAGVLDKKEGLLRLAAMAAKDHLVLDEVVAEDVVSAVRAGPGLVRLRKLLQGPLADELAALMAERGPYAVPATLSVADVRADVAAFLDEPSETTWAALCAQPAVVARHRDAQLLGLTIVERPGLPSVLDAARVPLPEDLLAEDDRASDRRLDQSLERRLQGVLRGAGESLLGLPDEETLARTEAVLATSALGLGRPEGHAMLSAGAALILSMDLHAPRHRPLTRATRRLEDHFETWRPDGPRFARLPYVLQNLVEAPVETYIDRLWVRVHGWEVRDSLPEDPTRIWATVVDVGRSVSKDLETLQQRWVRDQHRPVPRPRPTFAPAPTRVTEDRAVHDLRVSAYVAEALTPEDARDLIVSIGRDADAARGLWDELTGDDPSAPSYEHVVGYVRRNCPKDQGPGIGEEEP